MHPGSSVHGVKAPDQPAPWKVDATGAQPLLLPSAPLASGDPHISTWPPWLGSRSLGASTPGLIVETPTQPPTLGLLRLTLSSSVVTARAHALLHHGPALLSAPLTAVPTQRQVVCCTPPCWGHRDGLPLHQGASHSSHPEPTASVQGPVLAAAGDEAQPYPPGTDSLERTGARRHRQIPCHKGRATTRA